MLPFAFWNQSRVKREVQNRAAEIQTAADAPTWLCGQPPLPPVFGLLAHGSTVMRRAGVHRNFQGWRLIRSRLEDSATFQRICDPAVPRRLLNNARIANSEYRIGRGPG